MESFCDFIVVRFFYDFGKMHFVINFGKKGAPALRCIVSNCAAGKVASKISFAVYYVHTNATIIIITVVLVHLTTDVVCLWCVM